MYGFGLREVGDFADIGSFLINFRLLLPIETV
jgi:hypothetical protein